MPPTRSDRLMNNLHYKKEKKKESLHVIHDYVLLPRYSLYSALVYGAFW